MHARHRSEIDETFRDLAVADNREGAQTQARSNRALALRRQSGIGKNRSDRDQRVKLSIDFDVRTVEMQRSEMDAVCVTATETSAPVARASRCAEALAMAGTRKRGVVVR